MYPASDNSSGPPLNKSVFGLCPMAMKLRRQADLANSPVFKFLTVIPVTSPLENVFDVNQCRIENVFDFGLLLTRSIMIADALKVSRRWINVDAGRKSRQEVGFFERRVSTTDDKNFFVAEEETVAGGAS